MKKLTSIILIVTFIISALSNAVYASVADEEEVINEIKNPTNGATHGSQNPGIKTR